MLRKILNSRFWRRLDIPPKRALLMVGAVSLVFTLARQFNSVENLEMKGSRFAEFNFRHWMKRDPPVDPRIMIFGFGDSSLNELKEEELDLEDWTRVLSVVAKNHPRVVIIDKVFSAPKGIEGAHDFVSTLKSFDFPVVAGAFISSSPISSRPLQAIPKLSLFFPGEDASMEMEELQWLSYEAGLPYGPSLEIRDGFAGVGHVMYSGSLTVKPVLRLSRQDVIPASALFAAKEFHFKLGELYADGRKVPLDAKGRTIVNLSYPGAYFDRTSRLSTLVKKARNGEAVHLPKDSVVIILPAMYTGSSDMQPSPFGPLPGGYFVTAVASSVLNGKWVTQFRFGWSLILFSGVLGYLILFLNSGWGVLLSLSGISTGIGLLGLWSFSSLNFEIPWLVSLISFFSTAFLILFENARIARRKLQSFGEAEKDFAVVIEPSLPTDGVRLGRYHILESLGSGGMGDVFRAKAYGAGGFEKEFAIKRINAKRWPNASTVKLFEEEARLNSVLSHANIAQVFEFVRMNETYLMVMEFVRGKNLAQVLFEANAKNIPVPISLTVRIINEVCKGLEYAHLKTDEKGAPLNIIHRDISPQNVMLSYEGAVKLIDFGIAKGRFHSELTAAGIIKGKFAFMSPEQARGIEIDQRSDLFSVGLVLFEMLSGTRVFEGETAADTLAKVVECRIPSPQSLNLKLPQELSNLLGKVLSKDRDLRHRNASELQLDLEKVIDGYPRESFTQTLSGLLHTLFPHDFGPVKFVIPVEPEPPQELILKTRRT
jgi:tRNA A-37 threonylcarbamoyl transferase component Bud32